jgi:hypothetical protein
MPHVTVSYSLYLVLNLLFPHVSNFRMWMKLSSKNYCKELRLQLTIKKGLNSEIL